MLKNGIDRITGNPEEVKQIIRYLCFAFNKNDLTGLFVFLGPDKFVDFMDKFQGSYIKLPVPKRLNRALEQYRLYAIAVRIGRAKKLKDFNTWNDLETKFIETCKRMKIKHSVGKKLVRQTEKEVWAANEWWAKLQETERRRQKTDAVVE